MRNHFWDSIPPIKRFLLNINRTKQRNTKEQESRICQEIKVILLTLFCLSHQDVHGCSSVSTCPHATWYPGSTSKQLDEGVGLRDLRVQTKQVSKRNYRVGMMQKKNCRHKNTHTPIPLCTIFLPSPRVMCCRLGTSPNTTTLSECASKITMQMRICQGVIKWNWKP